MTVIQNTTMWKFILVLLLAGTFCTIYLASYRDMTEENRDLLHHYVESYVYPKMDRIPRESGKKEKIPVGSLLCWSFLLFTL